MPAPEDTSPYDALLLVSFGGPEKQEDVLPFLQNVTRGRGIPDARLEEVGEHYRLFGGRSPINDQNRALLAAIREDLAAHDIDLPVYWGNRNWDPYLDDVLAQMHADGVRRAACFVTSAYSSYSGCRQYRENLADAQLVLAGHEKGDAEAYEQVLARVAAGELPRLDKLRHYYNHPGYVAAVGDAVLAALADLAEAERQGAHLVFVTHSIPESMDAAAGPPEQGGHAYTAQHAELARLVTDRVAQETGTTHPHQLVFCSRSGPPHVPWLEPDVNDHLEALHAEGATAAVVVPFGFVSDHMEVIYDLDTEAAETAERLGLPFRRAATAGVDPRFVALVRDLLLERAAAERSHHVERAVSGPGSACWDVCPAGCCLNARAPERPAASGSDLPAQRELRSAT
ncbi:ferrochelatase [Nocardioidaceae bacterium]|nr:ferrochelatase [Nocardioidaceae bacterium]